MGNFTHAQPSAYAATIPGLSAAAALGSYPSVGDVVCCSIEVYDETTPSFVPTLASVQDEHGNNYNPSPNSPSSSLAATAGTIYLYYLIITASMTIGKTITATLNAHGGDSLQVSIYADDFTVAGGTAVFDTDIPGHAAGASSPTTLPVITPAGAGELLYAGAAISTTALNVSGPWVQNDHGVGAAGEDAAYITNSAAGGTAVGFTFTPTADYDTMAMAFKIVTAQTAPIGIFGGETWFSGR